MDILALNNELIKLRPKFQIAKRISLMQLKKNIISLQKLDTTSATKRPEIHELHKQIEHLKCTHLDEVVKLAFMYEPVSNRRRATTHDLVHARIYKIMKSKIEPLRVKYKLNVSKNMNELKRKWLEKLEKNRKIRRSKENKRMRKEGNAAKQKRMDWLKEHGVKPQEAPAKVVKKKDSSKSKSEAISNKPTNNEWTVEDLDHETIKKTSAPSDDVATNDEKTNVDSFFLTNSGENYVSSFITHTKLPNQQNKHNRPHQQGQFGRQDNKFNRPNNKNGQITSKPTPNKNRPPKPIAAKSTAVVASEDLHPSWAAKLNAKPLISEFQGKKIVFDN